MKIISKKTLVILVANSIVSSCAVSNINTPISQNTTHLDKSSNNLENNQGKVKFNLDFPNKFINNNMVLPKGFSIKALDSGKINRVKIRVEALTVIENKPFLIERNVDLVPGGVEATLSLPLNKLYTVTVQGMNDTTPVSGAEIKGYFRLTSSSITPTVEVSQSTTPIAKIIEGLRLKIAELEPIDTNPITSDLTTPTTGGTVEKTDSTTTTATPIASPTPFVNKDPFSTNKFKLADIDLIALNDVVERGRINAHPSLVNVQAYIDDIVKLKAVPFEVPLNPVLKSVSVKGKVSGLKSNEVAIVTIGDPSSKQTIVVSAPLVSKADDTEIDPDTLAPDVNFVIDNVTPGKWDTKVFASGYTQKDSATTITVEAGKDSTLDFKVEAANWLITPKNVSGSVGNSDQANIFKDEIDNIHAVWRQDGFDTDTNSGVINYSRWNGTSWTTQAVNISQYKDIGLRGSRDPGVAVGLDRLPQVVWSAKDNSGIRKIYFNKSDGTTWQTPIAINGSENGINTSLTVDRTNGYLYTVWESDNNIYLSQFNRTNWTNPINIGIGTIPKVNMGTDGIVHIVWKDTNSQKLHYSGWTESKGVGQIEDLPMDVLGNDTLNSLDTSVDRFNRLHVIWRNDSYIQYMLRSNVSWSQPEVVNRVANVLSTAKSGASLSVSPSGIVNVAWLASDVNDKQVIRFRRRLSDGWKNPFMRINDPTEPIKVGTTTETTTTTEVTEIRKSENIDGYEDIPLSGVTSVVGKPLINADGLGKIHVLWSNNGQSNNDTDLLHSLKTIETTSTN